MNSLTNKGKHSIWGKICVLFLIVAMLGTISIPYGVFGDEPPAAEGSGGGNQNDPQSGEEEDGTFTVMFELPDGFAFGDGGKDWPVEVSQGQMVPIDQIPDASVLNGNGKTFIGWSTVLAAGAVTVQSDFITKWPVSGDMVYIAVFADTGQTPPPTPGPGGIVSTADAPDPTAVGVRTWDELRAEITNANNAGGGKIRLDANIQRTGGTGAAADLPVITRNVSIDGLGLDNVVHSLDFRNTGATTAINRPGFVLGPNLTGQFTLKNINIIRSNATTYSLIANGTNAANTAWAAHNYNATNGTNAGYGAGWTANIHNVTGDPSVAPTAGLVTIPGGKVNFTGVNNWSLASGNNYSIVNAETITFTQGTLTTFNGNSFPAIYVRSDSRRQHTLLVSDPGTKVDIYTLGGTGANVDGTGVTGSGSIQYDIADDANNKINFIVQDQAILNVSSDGYGSGRFGGTVTVVTNGTTAHPGSGFTVTGGAKFNITSLSGLPGRPHTYVGASTAELYRGQPALIQQIQSGTFTLDGDGTELNVQSYGAYAYEYTAALRIRLVGNQKFNVTNKARLNVILHARPGAARNPAAIRFGDGVSNEFHVNSGGIVHVENGGNGTVMNGSGDGGNDGIEFSANNFVFDVSGTSADGQPSAIEIFSNYGPAVGASGQTGGQITIAEGAVFEAQGNTPGVTDAVFVAGSGFTFRNTNTLYYNFQNNTTRAQGGRVFDIASSGTGASQSWYYSDNSDVSVWGNGTRRDGASNANSNGTAGTTATNSSNNPVNGNPYKAWTRFNFSLRGEAFGTLNNSSDPTFNTTVDSFGSRGMQPYKRISANNAPPKIKSFVPATNADKYVRGLGTVPEGFNFDGRLIWDDEVFARLQWTPVSGSPQTVGAGTVRSIRDESVWTEEISTANPLYHGVVRYSAGAFLNPGDKYSFTSAWRGAVDDPAGNVHLAPATYITAGEVTVTDATPPSPVTISNPATTYFEGSTVPITGTYGAQLPYNPEPATALYAVLVPKAMVIANIIPYHLDPIKDTSGYVVYGTITGDASGGTWTYQMPAGVTLASGDRIYIVTEDANGNIVPLKDQPFHDATFPAAPYLTVAAGASNFDKKIIGADGNPTSNIVVTSPDADITYRLSALFPSAADMANINKVEITDIFGVGLKLKGASGLIPIPNPANVTVLVGGSAAPAPDSISYNPVTKVLSVIYTTRASLDQLAGKTITIDVIGNLDIVGGDIPATASNGGQIFLNDEKSNEIIVQPQVTVKGNISGVLFTDANGNGMRDSGESVVSGRNVQLFYATDAAMTNPIDTKTTGADGKYEFIVNEGSYIVKAGAPNAGSGYTIIVPAGSRTAGNVYNDAGNSGQSGPYTINRSAAGANLQWTANAGYTTLTVNTSPGAFSKDLISVDGKTTNGPIHSATADLEYGIVYVMPTNTAGYNHVELLDIMDPGLVLKGGVVDATNVRLTAVKSGMTIPVSPAPGYPKYEAGTGSNAGKMVVTYKLAENTDFSALSGATLTLTVTANIQQLGGAWPTSVTNTGRMIVNDGTSPLDVPNVENVAGLISGLAFVDTNRNGIKDAGESALANVPVTIKKWNPLSSSYEAYSPLTGDIPTTTSQGEYKFIVPEGRYQLEFPNPFDSKGITTSGPGYVPISGIVPGIDIALGNAAQQQKTFDVGYYTPDPTVTDSITSSFNKQVKLADGTFADTRTVTDFTSTIEYKLSFSVPAPPATGSTFAGFSTINITDVMQDGLNLAAVTAPDWNVQVLVGGTVISESIVTGKTATYTFDAAKIQQYLATAPAGTVVTVNLKAKLEQVAGSWPTKVTNKGTISINADPTLSKDVTRDVTVSGQGPEIAFTQAPLVVAQTPGVSTPMTAANLKSEMQVTDDIDNPTWEPSDAVTNPLFTDRTVVTSITQDGAPIAQINKRNIGVYKVTYTATDSNGNETIAVRAVVVDDGRYIINPGDNGGIIIGARNFVIKSVDVDGSESQARSASYAEAYDIDGDKLIVTAVPLPSDYMADAVAKDYQFDWKVTGYATPKTIIGRVTNADVVDPGDKDSQYALIAYHFQRNTLEAQAMVDSGVLNAALITAAKAEVVKLVPTATTKAVRVVSNGNGVTGPFSATPKTYPIRFGVESVADDVLKATIDGVVSNGKPPVIAATTPFEVTKGTTFTSLAGITVSDVEDLTLSTADVVYAPGSETVDVNTVGLYKVIYQVTDSDNNTSTARRLVVVNDGTYTVGQGRVLEATSFVTRFVEVTTSSALINPEIKNKGRVILYDGETGATVDQTDIADNGGYRREVNSYNIVARGIDVKSPGLAITKDIVGKVVDADVIVGPTTPDSNGFRYYAYGKNLNITISDAAALNTDELLLNALKAHTDRISPLGPITDAGVRVKSVAGPSSSPIAFSSNPGTYQITIADAANPEHVTAVLTVNVTSGQGPSLTLTPIPLKIPITTAAINITEAQLMSGVSATDVEDDADPGDSKVTTITITGLNKDGAPVGSLPANVGEVYQVTYTAKDSDDNIDVKSRAVIIDDGSFVSDVNYILRAKSFLINVDDVAPAGALRLQQILNLSRAKAWKTDGTGAVANVRDANTYRNQKGDYYPTIGIEGYAALTKEIQAKVIGGVTTNGAIYSIEANPFRINLPDADVLATKAEPAYTADFVARALAEGYINTGSSLNFGGTIELAGPVVKKDAPNAGKNFNAAGFTDGDVYLATFRIQEEPTTFVTVEVLVSNANAPRLNIPEIKQVSVGAIFTEGTPGDTTASYYSGVSASDVEDISIPYTEIRYTPTVDTTTEGAYTVLYSVEDSDHNRVTAGGVVLVGDWVVSNGYAIQAHDFTKAISEVTGTADEAKAYARARGVDLRPYLPGGTINPNVGQDVTVIVTSLGGYDQVKSGVYDITFAVDAERTANKTIKATVGNGEGPVIAFTQEPIKVSQTAVTNIMTEDEIKAFIQVTDKEDNPSWEDADTSLSLFTGTTYEITQDGAPIAQINKRNIGVYKVTYTATDSHGNKGTAVRAIVVDDGRFIIDPGDNGGIIIGARNFVVKSVDVDGSESQARSASYARAYTIKGDKLDVTAFPLPTGYEANASAGSYTFNWKVTGYSRTKTIIGTVTNADVVDPGDEDSQYALIASNFQKNTVDAQTMVDSGALNAALVAAAKAEVVILVPGAPAKAVRVVENGNGLTGPFSATPNTYPIRFGVEGVADDVLKATINGVVSNGTPPVITATTPIEVTKGTTFTSLAGITVSDAEDRTLSTADVVFAAGSEIVDVNTVGIYKLIYQIEDSDHNISTARRVVVVNDGTYAVGEGRILEATSFVTKLVDVTTSSALINAEIKNKGHIVLYDGETGATIDQAYVRDNGGYHKAVDSYNIVAAGIDIKSPGGEIAKSIVGKVVDADVIVGPTIPDPNGFRWYAYGKNLRLTTSQAAALDTDMLLLGELKAHTEKVSPLGPITDGGVRIKNVAGPASSPTAFSSNPGTYQITIADAANPEHVTAVLEVRVETGDGPVLTLTPIPLKIPITTAAIDVTEAQLLSGASAADTEDDSDPTDSRVTTITITGMNKDGVPVGNIPANIGDVYQVTYTAKDSDGNTDVKSRAVIIDDGSFVSDPYYILRAKSFLINVDDVAAAGNPRSQQILDLSRAKAWRTDGSSAVAYVENVNAYRNQKGDYYPIIGINGYAALTKQIQAKVVGGITTNGAIYSLEAYNFRINLPEADVLAVKTEPAYTAEFVARALAEGYIRTGSSLNFGGTVELAGPVVKKAAPNAGKNFNAAGFADGDVYLATFRIHEEPTTFVTVEVLVSNANPPVLNIPATKQVSVGAIFEEGTPSDTTPSYYSSVSATDVEDTMIPYTAISHTSPVDTSTQGAFTVLYSVEDSDHNRVTASGVVLVGDWIVSGGYAIEARDFSKKLFEVTGTEAEAIASARANAIDVSQYLADGVTLNPNFGKNVPVVVSNFDGYDQVKSGVFNITFAVDAERSVKKTIKATVDNGESPVIEFTEAPLVIPQSPVSSIATDSELKAKMKITDKEDGPIPASQAVSSPAVPIDKHNIGVYKVSYSVTDSNGNKTTAKRAVVVTDGRYIIDPSDNNGIIIGARNFVVAQENVNGTESQVRSLSYAEAYDADGNPLTVKLTILPSGYTAFAPARDYGFTWSVNGYSTTKSIIGTVTAATVVDPGTKDSQYALTASDFVVTSTQAAEIMKANGNFVTAANARIYKLVPGVPDVTVRVVNKGGFHAYNAAGQPETGSYDIRFGGQGLSDNALKAIIKGVVTKGSAPTLYAPTPIDITVGAVYNDSDVVAIDPEDGPITSRIVKDGTVDTSTPGIYPIHYSVTDNDGNTVTGDRVVVVNDGRYVVGSGRILEASSFVTDIADVSANAADLDGEILGKSSAKLYDGQTGAQLDAVFVLARGGYNKAVGVYTITIRGVDLPQPSGVSTLAYPDPILKTITGEVVDASVTDGPKGALDTTYIYGNDITVDSVAARTLTSPTTILTALGAGSRVSKPDGTLQTIGVTIKSGPTNASGNVLANGDPGLYTVVITDAAGLVEKTLTITVLADTGLPPTLDVPSPIRFTVGETVTGNNLMNGVTATDPDDGNITGDVKIDGSTPGSTPAIDTSVPGVVPVTYSVSDSDGNEVAVTIGVIVDDGSFVYNDEYILSAYGFIIGSKDVTPNAASVQILGLSNANAWKADGTPVLAQVYQTAGYTNVKGDYMPTLIVSGHPEVSKNITARVTDDFDGPGGEEATNGDKYGLSATNIRLSRQSAGQLVSMINFSGELALRTNAKAYLRADVNLPVFGNPILVGDVVRASDGKEFKTAVADNTLAVGDIFLATFTVEGEGSPLLTIEILISDGMAPELNVPAVKYVAVGGTFTNADYMSGVYATDNEDDSEWLTSQVRRDGTVVSTSQDGVYRIYYNVTDTDGNYVEKMGLVLVGWTPGDDYSIKANNFTAYWSQINGSEQEAIDLAEAQAICVNPLDPSFGKLVPVTVSSAGGYQKLPGLYRITFAVGAKPTVTKRILASIGDDRPNPPQPPIVIVQPPIVVPIPGPTVINTVETITNTTEIVTVPAVETPTTSGAIIPPTPSPTTTSSPWALLNLIFAMFSVVIMFMLIAMLVRRSREEQQLAYDGYATKRRGSRDIFGVAISALAAVIAVPVLFLTEDFATDMRLTDKYTIYMAMLAVVSILGALIMSYSHKKDSEEGIYEE